MTDRAVRRAILGIAEPSPSDADVLTAACLVALLGASLGLATVGASAAAAGTRLNVPAALGALLVAALGAPLLLGLPGRGLALVGMCVAAASLAMALPALLLLPSAIPLAVVIAAAWLVATEPQLPSRTELRSEAQTLRGEVKRSRCADWFRADAAEDKVAGETKSQTQSETKSETKSLAALEQERATRPDAWLEKQRSESPSSPDSSPEQMSLPSPTAPSELSYWHASQ